MTHECNRCIALRTELNRERDDNASLHNLLLDIREAAGDPHGRMMLPELVETIRQQRKSLAEHQDNGAERVRSAVMGARKDWAAQGSKGSPWPHVGQRLNDGYIVAGMVNGQWFAVAPADRRYVAKWDEAMERDTLPDFDQLMAIYANRELIDAADTSGGTNTLAAIGESDKTPYAWSSTEYSSHCARLVRLSDGGQGHDGKGNEHWVVPVRAVEVV